MASMIAGSRQVEAHVLSSASRSDVDIWQGYKVYQHKRLSTACHPFVLNSL